MATSDYLIGRKRYQRPQGVLWSNNSGILSNGLYMPNGYEVGAEVPTGTEDFLIDQFIILSDHNRGEIQFNQQRIEKRQRTLNGQMRSYHVADKLSIALSWTMLPSRSYKLPANFDEVGTSQYKNSTDEYTSDGGAGGVDMLRWYETHKGPFWMYLAYDKYDNSSSEISQSQNLTKYNEIVEVYFSNFSYSVVRRGGSNFDLWNISVSLEEV